MLPLVLYNSEIYIFVGLHSFFVWCVQVGLMDLAAFDIGTEPWKMMALTTSVLSFFIIFLLNQCFDRYKNIYNLSVGIMGTVLTCGAIMNVHLSASKFKRDRWHAMRYLIASVELVYFKVNDMSEATVDESEWERLLNEEQIQVVPGKPPITSPALLTSEERKIIGSYQGSAPVLLQMWALQVLKKAFAEAMPNGLAGGDSLAFNEVQVAVLELKGKCAGILNVLSMCVLAPSSPSRLLPCSPPLPRLPPCDPASRPHPPPLHVLLHVA